MENGERGMWKRNMWLVAGVLIALTAGIAVWKTHEKAPLMVAQDTPAQAAAPAKEELSMPSLAVADGEMLQAASNLSTSALYATWIKTGDLARKFVSTVNAVAEGRSPRPMLAFLAPTEPFAVTAEKHNRIDIDSKSFERFNSLADVVGSIDGAGAARAYQLVHGLLSIAYGEIAPPGSTLDDRLASAIDRLTKTPVPKEPLRVIGRNGLYMYADDDLEMLPPVAKALIRMGPRNEKLIQAKLSEIAAALHLPMPVSAKAPPASHRPG